MKHISIATAAAAALLATSAFAQHAPSTAPASAAAPAATAAPAPIQPARFIRAQTSGQWLASDLIGTSVRGPGDETLGEVDELVIDSDGRVTAAVIGVGGFLGLGEKDVAVPFQAMQVVRDGDDAHLVLHATKDELKAAPAFKTRQTAAAAGDNPATPMTKAN